MSTENGKILNHLLFCTSILDSFFKLSEGRFSVFSCHFKKKLLFPCQPYGVLHTNFYIAMCWPSACDMISPLSYLPLFF